MVKILLGAAGAVAIFLALAAAQMAMHPQNRHGAHRALHDAVAVYGADIAPSSADELVDRVSDHLGITDSEAEALAIKAIIARAPSKQWEQFAVTTRKTERLRDEGVLD